VHQSRQLSEVGWTCLANGRRAVVDPFLTLERTSPASLQLEGDKGGEQELLGWIYPVTGLLVDNL
jgi:hypothetical protein